MARSAPLFALVMLAAISVQASPPETNRESPTTSPASTCYISQQCSSGGSVSCSGPAGTCTSGSTWVECNGNRYNCPNCEPYCSPCDAQVNCSYGGIISCDSSQTPLYHYCEEGSDFVYCEGAGTLTCDACYPAIWCHIP